VSEQRIAVVGTGANGAAIGADFVRAGLDVTFIEQWPAHVEAMRANGLRVESPDGTEVKRVRALHLCEVATLQDDFDVVFLGVKAYDTRWATELIRPVLAADGFVVGLQNGMTHDDIAGIVGPERTIGAVIEIASNMWEPGITNRQNDHDESWFALGAVDPGQREAATSLGFGRIRAFTTVVFPQAIRVAVPSLVNQFVDIVKDSSIVAIIGTTDLMGVTNQAVSFYRAPFELYTLVAGFYLALVLSISAAAAALERRLQRHVR
jgi:2-dehydropantoate 2-reductase